MINHPEKSGRARCPPSGDDGTIEAAQSAPIHRAIIVSEVRFAVGGVKGRVMAVMVRMAR